MTSISALSDPTRREIVELLAKGPRSSGEIARKFSTTPPAISQHLKKLKAAKLVRVRIDAQRRIYELDPHGIDELSDWIAHIRRFWSAKLDTLQQQLEKDPP
jgi:DNA-binding transcriptional ArsR family regulator